ncbi:hypothetical protein [Bradyrhizobium vignae]|uniref:Methyl-accepting chemotaxis protein n=1 Tax=Bradyrhizobium vignae TaxID=1549949 RepID=A0A2U3QB52_9BRAD|nr:protein of unknown function [Bradyrhizobium vignae]
MAFNRHRRAGLVLATEEIGAQVIAVQGETSGADGIAATGAAAEEVLGSTIELSKQSQRLRDEVDLFLAQIRAA